MTESSDKRLGVPELAQTWLSSLSQVLGQMAGAEYAVTVLVDKPSELDTQAPSDLWMAIAFTGWLRGEMSLYIPGKSVTAVAQVFLGTPAEGALHPESDCADAVQELCR